ncbi:unnamed protein product [Commensalibacter papalotli (ex Botero et al. 2024)]|nr:unnamed protein product [Commensalibacter papalotli (ex Botero et al. 2024)]
MLIVVFIGLQGGIAAKRYYQGRALTGLENAPLILSVIGCFLTFIYSVFYLSSISLIIPILGKIFGISFYLDSLNSFCLFCLFFCGALFIFFKKELGVSHYFLLPYVNVTLLLLAGNLFFVIGLLAFLIMMNYGLSIGKSLAPFVGLASLFLGIILLPAQMGEQGNFAYLSFETIRQISFSPWVLFCVLITSGALMGFVPFSQWRMNIARQGKGDVVYSFMHLLLSMAGIYLLLRFYIDLGKHSETYWLSFLVKILGVIAACYAGWQSLVVKQFHERVSCLYILGNAVIVQTIGIVTSFMGSDHQQSIAFANDALYFGLFVQFVGFTFVFLLSGFLKDYYNAKPKETLIPSSILISLFLLSFLLSGLPPFAGFSVFCENLQLLLFMPSGHYLSNSLLGILIIGLNAAILILGVLGWIRLILTGGTGSLQKAFSELSEYLSLKFFAEVKIGIYFLFIITLLPGLIFIIARSVAVNVMGLSVSSHNFFTFSVDPQQTVFMPWLIAVLLTVIMLIITWVARKEKKKTYDFLLRDSIAQPNIHRSVIVEETSFSFGQACFESMLKRRFSWITSFSTVNYVIFKNLLKFKKNCLSYTHRLNLLTWQYQNFLMLFVLAIVLISISFVAR